MDSKQLLEMVVKAADGRRAEDIVALKVDEISPMADYFVIMTGFRPAGTSDHQCHC